MTGSTEELRESVRARYAAAASSCCGPAPTDLTRDATGAAVFGATLYDGADGSEVDEAAAALAGSLGCGVPTAVADLRPGETVLDLGSGAGGDVLISAHRVGPTGRVIGIDMTTEMLDLARRNATEAGVTNVEFRHGYLEQVPLPDDTVDVVISNCVLNLAADKTVVLGEAARVLRPGGRLAFSDVVADEGMDEATRADVAAWTGCIAGALTEAQLRAALGSAGFVDLDVRPTHRVHPHAQAAIIRAVLPVAATSATRVTAAGETEIEEPRMTTTTANVEVFDPAMCCPTGVCGPSIDPALARFESDLRWLVDQGATVTRRNLAQEPGAFVEHPLVAAMLASGGEEVLPIVLVDGKLRSSGTWLSRAELAAAAGATTGGGDETATESAGGSACTPSSSGPEDGCC